VGLQSAVPAGLVLLLQRVLDRGLIERDPQVLLSVPLGLVALYALQGGADFARGMITRRVSWAGITALKRATSSNTAAIAALQNDGVRVVCMFFSPRTHAAHADGAVCHHGKARRGARQRGVDL
jgi:hypothetical protein